MELQVLTVQHYGADPAESRRLTLSPANIIGVAACTEDVVIQGRSLVNVTVLFLEGGSLDLSVNHSDLERIEKAIGSYCLG